MASRQIPGGVQVLRAAGAKFFTVLVLLLTVPVLVSAFFPVTDRTPAIAVTALTAAYLGWTYFWRPLLRIEPEAVTIVNPWHTQVVPWESLIDIETRFWLTLVTPEGSYAAHAAPAPGGRRSFRTKGDDASKRASDLVTSDSGHAATILRTHWQRLVEDGALDLGDPRLVSSSRRDTPVMVLGIVGVVLSVALWLVT